MVEPLTIAVPDLSREVWVETTLEEMKAGAPPKRKATPLEAYEILTRRMLQARITYKDEPEKQEASDSHYCDWLDQVWDELSQEERDGPVKETTRRLMWDPKEGFVVDHHEKDVYSDGFCLYWRATGEMLKHKWDV